MSTETRIDLHQVRRRLDGQGGRRYWKSLEELADTPGFQSFLHREFPENASVWTGDAGGRRDFLRLMGASMALAGLTACTKQPPEKIVPYVRQPEGIVPGKPQFYATALGDHGYAKGVLVESHMGRPTKIEGNPEHPASLGGTDLYGQAAILALYDPDRSQNLLFEGEIRTWSQFTVALKAALDAQKALKGKGLRLLTEPITSPTLAAQVEALLAEHPEARWHQWEPAGRNSARVGAQLAFGQSVEARYHLDQADVVLSLDCDFVSEGPANVRHIRDFASRRRLQAGVEPNRLYVIEGSPSATGASADHKLVVKPSQVEGLARAVAAGLGLAVAGGSSDRAAFVAGLVKDLQAHAGRSLVLAGDGQPPAVHALAHAINEKLGNFGKTVTFSDPVEARPVDHLASLAELCADLEAGQVDVLIVIDANPVYSAPADIAFKAALGKARLRIHAGLYLDETGERCQWHVPLAHTLESWGDLRAWDGTATLVQPLIAPLYGSKSAHELLAACSGQAAKPGHDVVREHWQQQLGPEFEARWRQALHGGLVAGTAFQPRPASVQAGAWAQAAPAAVSGLELVFRPDPSVGDGRWANSGWLQELPKAITKLTWDNAALMSPRTAERLGVKVGSTSRGQSTELVELRYKGRAAKAPAWIVPGHPDDVVTLHLGYGRTRAGRVGDGLGVNASLLRTSDAPGFGGGLEVKPTGQAYTLACTQDHWTMEAQEQVRARNLMRVVELEEYQRDPHKIAEEFAHHRPAKDLTLYPPDHKYEGNAWGLVVDLNACVGCNACVVACVAENNIPVVGKEQVAMGREMHWIRVDRYYEGDLDQPAVHHQPVLCMQCENAPCEMVCPVAATSHNEEGLNDMAYNRCVGTRYCSNNCPYKVRRFNFFLYQDWETPSLKLQRNPDVSVRSRGVMEKCTYCVQRINVARIEARGQDRPIKDGDIKTACEQACPAQAITFGDVNDPQSRVARLKQEPRNYGLLEELGARPRTSYLAVVKNPNPEISHG